MKSFLSVFTEKFNQIGFLNYVKRKQPVILSQSKNCRTLKCDAMIMPEQVEAKWGGVQKPTKLQFQSI